MPNEIQTSELLFGLCLGAVVTLVTNFIWNRKKESDKQGVLLIGLTSEIKVIRENLSAHLNGMRITLEKNENPRPDGLGISSVIYTSNTGTLGLFGNSDFVDHLVETYSSLAFLVGESDFFKRFTNNQISRESILEYHIYATCTHLQIIRLHNRLLSELKRSHQLENNTEKTTRALCLQYEEIRDDNSTAWMYDRKSFSLIGKQDQL